MDIAVMKCLSMKYFKTMLLSGDSAVNKLIAALVV